MAQRKFTSACRWLIEQRPDLIKELPREAPENMWVFLGDGERLGLDNVRIGVSNNFRIYQLTKTAVRDAEILFVTPDDLYAHGYASIVEKNRFKGLNQFKNVIRVLDCPWASHQLTSRLLDRLYRGRVVDAYGFHGFLGVEELPHPFLK